MDFNETIYRFRPGIWINDLVIISFLTLVSLYLLVALLYHHIKVDNQHNGTFFCLSVEEKYSLLSKYACIFIAVASLLLHVSSITVRLIEGNAVFDNASMVQTVDIQIVCRAFPPIRNFAITFGSGLVYLFLWFRQRVFYVHSSLKILSNKCLRVFSFAVLVLWILLWISLVFSYLIEVQYRFDFRSGCLAEVGSDMPYFVLVFVWAAASILMQIALLSLFIYPILKRNLWRSHQQNQGYSRLMKRVKKAVILESICLGTDILSVVVLFLLYEENATQAIFMYSLNLVVNHLVVIGCFDCWKKLLWPWYRLDIVIPLPSSKPTESLPAASLSATQESKTCQTGY